MGAAFVSATSIPASWLSQIIVQCGPILVVSRRRRRELQVSPTATMSPAVGSSVIFSYVVLIPLNAPPAQITLVQSAIAGLTTAPLSTLTSSLVAGVFPSATVTNDYGSVNGAACGSAPGLPSCESLFRPAPAPASVATPVGAIVGGVIGGVVVIVVVALVVFFCRRAKARAAEIAELEAAAAAAQADSPKPDASQFSMPDPMAAPPEYVQHPPSAPTAREEYAIDSPADKRAGALSTPVGSGAAVSVSYEPITPPR